jgi:tRNA-binding EMAP/Myf-like protein
VDELLIGRIVAADHHPGSRAASYLLTVDVGSRGEVQASVERGPYERDELVGKQVVVSLTDDGAVLVTAHSHGGGQVILHPERDVEPGTVVA